MIPRTEGVARTDRVSRQGRLPIAAISLVLVTVFLDLPNYLAALNPDFQPKRIYFALAGVCLLHLAFTRSFLLQRTRPGLLILLLAYLLVNVLHAQLMNHEIGSGAQDEAWYRIQIVVLGVLIAWSASTLSPVQLGRVLACCTLIAVLTIAFDFFFPKVLYPVTADGAVPGRAGGILVSSTRAGEVLVLTTLLALPALTARGALLLMLAAGAAVFMTLSRGAISVWFVAYLALCANGALPRYSIPALVAGLVLLLSSAGVMIAYQAGVNPAADVEDLRQRLGFLTGAVPTDDSALERALVLSEGIRVFTENLLFGAGVGATSEWIHPVGTHNQPVMMAAEYGIFGLACWLGLVTFCATGRYFARPSFQWIAAAAVVLFSGLMHGMLDFVFWIVAIMLISMHRQPIEFRRAPT